MIRATNQTRFRAHYGLADSVPLAGPYEGNLANGGEQITLKVGRGGHGDCLLRIQRWSRLACWRRRARVIRSCHRTRASPGQATGALDYPGQLAGQRLHRRFSGAADPAAPATTVVLNEITAHTDYYDPLKPEYDSNDWIELYNTTGTDITLAGWFLSDDPDIPGKWADSNDCDPCSGTG